MLQDVLFESEEFAAAPVLTPQQESHYLQAYLPLVRKVVRQLAPQCNCIIDRQDMEQTALMGLLNAIRRYGLPDEGFAGYAVHRIRGAILDELRALDWRPRQLRQKYHQMKDLIRETRKKLGHEPEWSELAVEGISHEDYLEYQQLEGAETLASLDETAERRRAWYSACWPGTGRSVCHPANVATRAFTIKRKRATDPLHVLPA